MSNEHFDDGLMHNHHWAATARHWSTEHRTPDRKRHPIAADTHRIPTPSSVFHDDQMFSD